MHISTLVVLISGTRSHLNEKQKEIISSELEYVQNNLCIGFNGVYLIHGGCSGVDQYVSEKAAELGWKSIVFRADWSKGKRAGPERNQKMIDNSHIFLAFPICDSKGTIDCIKRIDQYERSTFSRLKYRKEINID